MRGEYKLKADESDNIYRYIGGEEADGILSCGYMAKSAKKTQSNFVIPYYSCFLLLSGSGEYQDEQGVHEKLSPGCVVQRIPDRVHTTKVEEGSGWLEFYVSFGRSFYRALASVGLLSASPVFRINPEGFPVPECNRLLNRIKQAADSELFPVLTEAQNLVLALMSEASGTGAEEEWTARACKLLEQNPGNADAARGAAAGMAMGYESFRKLFKQRTGMSPGAYCMERKMRTAKLMLLSGQTVKQTAQNLGYADAYIFSRQFKKHTGVTPGSFRRDKKGRQAGER